MKQTKKIILYSLCFMFLVGAVLLGSYYQDLKSQFNESFERRSSEIVSDISALLRSFIITGNLAYAYNYVEQISTKRRIEYFKIDIENLPTDFGRTISEIYPPPGNAIFDKIDEGLFVYNDKVKKIRYYKQTMFFDELERSKAADIFIGFSYGYLDAQINSLKYKFILLIFLLLIVLMVTFVWAKRSQERNYELFLEYFSKISRGEGIKTFNKISDYSSILAKAHEMANKVLEYQKKIQDNKSLISIGQSTAMVAHDVRKPLASMKALLTSLPNIKDNPEELKKMISAVDGNIARTNAMLNEILDFSRDSSALEIKEHDPQSIITSALGDALRNHPDSVVDIEYDLKHRHTLNVDGTRITRVITNILDNALDAMTLDTGKAFGKIKISSYDASRDGRAMVGIKVTDEGPGIPEDALAKVFDPFFTKGKKGGTGLGLAISHRIISMHGGSIVAGNIDKTGESGVKHTGAELTIELPAGSRRIGTNESELIHSSKELRIFREEEAARVDDGDTMNTAEFMRINKERGRQSYLLVVDDEPLFRETVRSLLHKIPQVRDHIKIIEAESAETAMNIFAAREFDYVIADIDLGKNRMDGYSFVQDVLQNFKNTYVLIHSNKRKDELDRSVRRIDSEKFMGFLPKPMKSNELLQFLACKSLDTAAMTLRAASTPKKILLLNDDEDFNLGLKLTLKGENIQVIDSTNVSDALKLLLENNKIDAVFSDINLGNGLPDGYEFLSRVKAAGVRYPFYFMSGYSKDEVWEKAEKLGATGYLQLPFEIEELKSIVGI